MAFAALGADVREPPLEETALGLGVGELERADEARREYGRALELAHTEPERRFLERRLADVGA